MKRTLTFGAIVILATAGCDIADNTSPDEVPAALVSQSAGTALAAVSYDDTANTLTVTVNGVERGVLASTTPLNETFDRYTLANAGAFGALFGLRAVSDTGASEVLVATSDNSSPIIVVEMARNVETDVPTSGELTYVGDYIGIIDTSIDSGGVTALDGRVTLTTSFETGDTSGSVTGRNFVDVGPIAPPLSLNQPNLTFDVGQLDDAGAFSGTITGATYEVEGGRNEGTYRGDGTYSGLISGATGDEAVGTIVINYDEVVSGRNASYTETGVFILDAADAP